MLDLSEELSALLESGRDVRIPISSPHPVTEADAERLYALTDECVLASDDEGDFALVEEDGPTIRRVLDAMRTAGFRSALIDAVLCASSFAPLGSNDVLRAMRDEFRELKDRVDQMEKSLVPTSR
jgi:hypothetical protein